jgi:hypothetical protein
MVRLLTRSRQADTVASGNFSRVVSLISAGVDPNRSSILFRQQPGQAEIAALLEHAEVTRSVRATRA